MAFAIKPIITMMFSQLLFVVRLFQFLFSTVIIALVGAMISTSGWNALPRNGGNAAEVNFTMFLGVLAFVTSPVLGLINWKGSDYVMVNLGAAILDGLNAIFFMGGAIGLASAMNIHSCSNAHYTTLNPITNSSANTESRCREAQAMTAFVWFEFALFIFTTGMSIKNFYTRQKMPDEVDYAQVEYAAAQPQALPPMVTTAVPVERSVRDSYASFHSVAAGRPTRSVHPSNSIRSLHPALSGHPAVSVRPELSTRPSLAAYQPQSPRPSSAAHQPPYSRPISAAHQPSSPRPMPTAHQPSSPRPMSTAHQPSSPRPSSAAYPPPSPRPSSATHQSLSALQVHSHPESTHSVPLGHVRNRPRPSTLADIPLHRRSLGTGQDSLSWHQDENRRISMPEHKSGAMITPVIASYLQGADGQLSEREGEHVNAKAPPFPPNNDASKPL